MTQNRSFVVGGLSAIAVLMILWIAVILQFGGIQNGFHYLEGYNYLVCPTALDVGERVRGKKQSAKVVVRNLSFSPIRVIGVVATCNCMTTTDLPITIMPREEKDLAIEILMKGKNNKVEQVADVLIDDGKMRRTSVLISGTCKER
jgi:hypothetical protein